MAQYNYTNTQSLSKWAREWKQGLINQDSSNRRWMLRPFSDASSWIGEGVIQRVYNDMMTMGAVSPETRQLVTSMSKSDVHDNIHDSNGEKRHAADTLVDLVRGVVTGLPVWNPNDADPNQTVKMYGAIGVDDPNEFIKQYMTNTALGYLDPVSAAETRQYLARANPIAFRAYEATAVPTNPNNASMSTQELSSRLLNAANAMNVQNMYSDKNVASALTNYGADSDKQTSLSQGQAGTTWMREYLRSAAEGLGGTRAEQKFANERMATLEREAESNPEGLGQYRTLAENIVNPVRQRNLSGIIGNRRSLTPGQDFMRKGFTQRNLSMT